MSLLRFQRSYPDALAGPLFRRDLTVRATFQPPDPVDEVRVRRTAAGERHDRPLGTAFPVTAEHDPTNVVDLTVHSAPWCGHRHRLKAALTRADIPFAEVDADRAPGAVAIITEIGGGSWLIPAVVLLAGSGLVNPGVQEIRERLT